MNQIIRKLNLTIKNKNSRINYKKLKNKNKKIQKNTNKNYRTIQINFKKIIKP